VCSSDLITLGSFVNSSYSIGTVQKVDLLTGQVISTYTIDNSNSPSGNSLTVISSFSSNTVFFEMDHPSKKSYSLLGWIDLGSGKMIVVEPDYNQFGYFIDFEFFSNFTYSVNFFEKDSNYSVYKFSMTEKPVKVFEIVSKTYVENLFFSNDGKTAYLINKDSILCIDKSNDKSWTLTKTYQISPEIQDVGQVELVDLLFETQTNLVYGVKMNTLINGVFSIVHVVFDITTGLSAASPVNGIIAPIQDKYCDFHKCVLSEKDRMLTCMCYELFANSGADRTIYSIDLKTGVVAQRPTLKNSRVEGPLSIAGVLG